MAQDGIEVAEWVLEHLKARKLILFGASGGTILGTLMVKRRPDLFWAYVGAGQFVDGKQGEALGYKLALERAEKPWDRKPLQALETIGPPPYADQKTFMMERRAMGKVGVETFPSVTNNLAVQCNEFCTVISKFGSAVSVFLV